MMPHDRWHDVYQRYYLDGLKIIAKNSNIPLAHEITGEFPAILRLLASAKNIDRIKFIHPLLKTLEKSLIRKDNSISGVPNSLVGEYVVELLNDKKVNFCIDAADTSELSSPNLSDWANVYFKTNFAIKNNYPKNVIPLINGSKFCSDNLALLKSMRGFKKEYDITAVLRVWGGTNSTDGIEHNIRILEELNKIKSRKKIIAGVIVAGDKKKIKKRLESQGILVLDKLMPLKKVWELGPKSTFSFQRLGMHYCMHWRYIESLASGTAVILDTPPKNIWPKPLLRGSHYESFELGVNLDSPLASDKEYSEIAPKLDNFLSKSNLSANLKIHSANYFDNYASPERTADYILSELQKFKND